MDKPLGRLSSRIYDGTGRLTATVDGQGARHVINFDRTGNAKGAVPLADAALSVPSDATEQTVRGFVHTFEFRLSGSEAATKSKPLPTVPASDCLMAATQAVRLSVTRSPDRLTASIGGVQRAAAVGGQQGGWVAPRPDFAAL